LESPKNPDKMADEHWEWLLGLFDEMDLDSRQWRRWGIFTKPLSHTATNTGGTSKCLKRGASDSLVC
jgi:hypothetical protein